MSCNLASLDNEYCLTESPGWGTDYSCKGFASYDNCRNYERDMRRCCPQSCPNEVPFTEVECKKSDGRGSCIYPFETLAEDCNMNGTIYIEKTSHDTSIVNILLVNNKIVVNYIS